MSFRLSEAIKPSAWRNLPDYFSDTIYPYYSLPFAWGGGRTRERADGEVEKKNAPSVGNKLPPAPHNDGEP